MPHRGNRRELLAEAAIAVLARDGGRGLTHRAIDREAKVPEGTTKNYYPSRDSLFLAVARYLRDQHLHALRDLRDRMPDDVTADDVASLYTSMLRRMTSSGRPQFLALIELHLEGVRRPEVRKALDDIALSNVDTTVHLRAAVGERMSRRGGGLLQAGLLGVALSLLSLSGEVLDEMGFADEEALGSWLLALAAGAEDPAVDLVRDQAG